jgi:formate dehydrogenase major subunit
MPEAGDDSLAGYIEEHTPNAGFWHSFDAYAVSLLKAWYGAAATEENDFAFAYLPRVSGDHSHYATALRMLDGKLSGYFVMGENPAVGTANGRLHRLGFAKLDWMVVRDLAEIETATWWRDGPEIQSGELRTEDIKTEVFLMPAAAHTEKEGTFTNTQRLLQWREQAVEPPADCRSELWFMYHLGRAWRVRQIRAIARSSTSCGTTPSRGSTAIRARRRCCAR